MSESVGNEPRYRPGRGGYDPEAAELAAHARCTFRQRVVLVLVLLAAASALVAVGLTMPEAWWVHGAADLTLVVYLVNLRRQVRLEQQIRARRGARLAAGRGERGTPEQCSTPEQRGGPDQSRVLDRRRGPQQCRDPAWGADLDPAAQTSGETVAGVDPETDDGDAPPDQLDPADRPALPTLRPVPLPPQPAGTERLELDDEDPELHHLDHHEHWGYRRAAGQ
ncbi:MAG: hypothetical protein H0V92_03590 [Pseudonocardiales bacterium]|nr:hypothetical protein [Pseudonocardiales bacterium]